MKRSVYTILVSVALVLASCLDAWAIKAVAKIVKYRQPDGSFVSLKVVGDEFFGYTTTLQGHIVSVGPDGFLHKADYSTAVVRSQARRLLDAQRPAAIHTRAAAAPSCSSLVLLVQFADLQFS
ncbi:MAG: hypothetical protein IKU18_05180, partial [Bacteroidales bacterium]|nr:hypothetical protein [Bacteroidales bacterium]